MRGSTKLSPNGASAVTELQGLALDNARGFLFVACGDHVVSLDARPRRKNKRLDTRPGPVWTTSITQRTAKLLYAAASQAATLTHRRRGRSRKISSESYGADGEGARGVVAGKGETAYPNRIQPKDASLR